MSPLRHQLTIWEYEHFVVKRDQEGVRHHAGEDNYVSSEDIDVSSEDIDVA